MSYASSAVQLALSLEAAPEEGGHPTRIASFGICKRSEVPTVYPYQDPPNAGDNANRTFSFAVTDRLFIFGKVLRTDVALWEPNAVGGGRVILSLTDQAGRTIDFSTTTGATLGEFNFTIEASSLPPGSYIVLIQFVGA